MVSDHLGATSLHALPQTGLTARLYRAQDGGGLRVAARGSCGHALDPLAIRLKTLQLKPDSADLPGDLR